MNQKRHLIAGCMRWGVWGKGYDTVGYQKMIESCMDSGIHTFDHADIYGGYTTESEFGAAISAMAIDREDYQLITKCGIRYPSDERLDNYLKSYDYSADYILQSVDNSLSYLKTDYIDQLLFHRPSPIMRADDMAMAVEQLMSCGKIRSVGVSNFSMSQIALLEKYIQFPIAANQIEISMLHMDHLHDGLVDEMSVKDIAVQAWSPLGGASLWNATEEDDMARYERLQDVANKYGWSLSEMGLLFLWHHPAEIVPVIGTGDPQRISNSVNVWSTDISDQQWFEIWSAATGQSVP